MPLIVEADALRLVLFERGDDGDFPADAAEVRPVLRDKLALTSLLGEGERLLEVRQHGGDKLGSARHAAELGNCARDPADVLRPRRVGAQVDADADDERGNRAAFALDDCLGQRAVELFLLHEHIVDPLDFRREACRVGNRPRDRDRRRERRVLDVRQRQGRVEQDGEVNAGTRGRNEGAAEPSASAGLLLGGEHEAVRPVKIALLHDRVGRGE